MSIENKASKVERLRQELANAEQDLARAKRAREDEPRVGSKILIRAAFPSNPTKVYEYMAMHTRPETRKSDAASWYITGRQGKVTWDYIISLVDRADYEILELQFLQL